MTVLLNPHRFAAPVAGDYYAQVAADSPLAVYKTDEASGTTMLDSSGNARNGTYSGPTLGAAGIITGGGTAADFDGVNDLASVASAAWMPTDTMSFGCVIRLDDVANECIAARWDTGSASRRFLFRVLSGKLQLSWNNGASVLNGATTLTTGTTYHVMFTVGAGTGKVYLAGAPDGSLIMSGYGEASLPLSLGGFTGTGGWLDGRIAGAAVFNTVLSDARAAAHAAAA